MIAELTMEQEAQVEAKVAECLQIAERAYGKKFPAIPCQFDLRGRSVGMFCQKGKNCWLRFNPWLFARHFEENLTETVPHEVAHYICRRRYRLRRIRPHGVEWQAVMHDFGVPAKRTHDHDISDLPVRQMRRFAYRCACREHSLSTVRHNRMLRGTTTYSCRKCKAVLVLEPA